MASNDQMAQESITVPRLDFRKFNFNIGTDLLRNFISDQERTKEQPSERYVYIYSSKNYKICKKCCDFCRLDSLRYSFKDFRLRNK